MLHTCHSTIYKGRLVLPKEADFVKKEPCSCSSYLLYNSESLKHNAIKKFVDLNLQTI